MKNSLIKILIVLALIFSFVCPVNAGNEDAMYDESFDFQQYLELLGYDREEIPEEIPEEVKIGLYKDAVLDLYNSSYRLMGDHPLITPSQKKNIVLNNIVSNVPYARQALGIPEEVTDESEPYNIQNLQNFLHQRVPKDLIDNKADFYIREYAKTIINDLTPFVRPFLKNISEGEYIETLKKKNQLYEGMTVKDILNFSPKNAENRRKITVEHPKHGASAVDHQRSLHVQEHLLPTENGRNMVAGKIIELAMENWFTIGIGLVGGVFFVAGGLISRLLGSGALAVAATLEIGAVVDWMEGQMVYDADTAGNALIMGLLLIAINAGFGLVTNRIIAGQWRLGRKTRRELIGMMAFFSWLPAIQPSLFVNPLENLVVRFVYIMIACIIGYVLSLIFITNKSKKYVEKEFLSKDNATNFGNAQKTDLFAGIQAEEISNDHQVMDHLSPSYCSNCNKNDAYPDVYSKYFCPNCNVYVTDALMQQKIIEHKETETSGLNFSYCAKCKRFDAYIDTYNRYFCPNCNEYVSYNVSSLKNGN